MVFTLYHPYISLFSHDIKEDREKETPKPRKIYNEYLVVALMCDLGQAGSPLFGASLSHHMLFEELHYHIMQGTLRLNVYTTF